MARLNPRARLEMALARAADTGACRCQTVTLESTAAGSFRYVVSRRRTVKARCEHWYVKDDTTGRLTDIPVTPRIGGQRRYGVSRASHKSMTSPWNKQGPSLAQMR